MPSRRFQAGIGGLESEGATPHCCIKTTMAGPTWRVAQPVDLVGINNARRVPRCVEGSGVFRKIFRLLLSIFSVRDDYKMNDPARKAVPLAPTRRGRAMKYICLGYYDKDKHESMTEGEQHAMFDTCFEYDDHLRANGHWAGGEALQPAENALTLYWKNGKVATTDGPYAETKEQLGGLLVLEARDLNQAVQLIAQHPALKYGSIFEIRPVGDMTETIKASEQRRLKDTSR